MNKITGKYKNIRILGSGGYSKVYEMLNLKNNKRFAFKEFLEKCTLKDIKNELSILKLLENEEIFLKFYGY